MWILFWETDRTWQLWKYCSLCWLSRMWELFPPANVMWMCAASIRNMLMSVFVGRWLCSAVDAYLSDFQLLDIPFYLICHVVRMLCYIDLHSFHNSLDTLPTGSPLCNRIKYTHCYLLHHALLLASVAWCTYALVHCLKFLISHVV